MKRPEFSQSQTRMKIAQVFDQAIKKNRLSSLKTYKSG